MEERGLTDGALAGPMQVIEKVARPERFELPTFWFVARRSIQLSYGRAVEPPRKNARRRAGKSLTQAEGRRLHAGILAP